MLEGFVNPKKVAHKDLKVASLWTQERGPTNGFGKRKESPPYFLKETRKTLKNSFVLGKQKIDSMFKMVRQKSLLETREFGDSEAKLRYGKVLGKAYRHPYRPKRSLNLIGLNQSLNHAQINNYHHKTACISSIHSSI